MKEKALDMEDREHTGLHTWQGFCLDQKSIAIFKLGRKQFRLESVVLPRAGPPYILDVSSG